MKAYIITEAQMEALCSRLEVAKLHATDDLNTHHPARIPLQDLHRHFNMIVRQWISEMGKP